MAYAICTRCVRFLPLDKFGDVPKCGGAWVCDQCNQETETMNEELTNQNAKVYHDTWSHILTKREQFAMAAMQGILASETHGEGLIPAEKNYPGLTLWQATAARAYEIADAMLAASERKDGD